MKAIQVHRFGGPEVLEIRDIDLPKVGPGQVRIRVHAVGVNPVDTYWRTGANPSLQLPFTPGLDAAGIVEELGSEVTNLQVGARVYSGGSVSGTYAEQVVARAEQVHPLPESISFEQGATLHVPYATAHRALFHRGEAKAGETVLIHGASGGVGLAATQFARAAGLTVIGTAGTERGRELVLREGAHHVVDHRSPDYLQQVIELSGGGGVNLILEMLSNINLGKDLPVLAREGRVVVIGSRGKVEITPRDLMTRETDIRGMSLFNVGAKDLQSIHTAIRAGLTAGFLRPVIGKKLALAQAAQAHQEILEPGAYGKILLIP